MSNPSPDHIVIIDDNEDMLVMLAIQLRQKGYLVTARRSFTHFDKEIVELRPRLVLIDKKLGWADGIELCTSIKSNPLMKGVQVIIFSAYPLSAKECRASGADAVFEKPDGMSQFLRDINAFLHEEKS